MPGIIGRFKRDGEKARELVVEACNLPYAIHKAQNAIGSCFISERLRNGDEEKVVVDAAAQVYTGMWLAVLIRYNANSSSAAMITVCRSSSWFAC